VFSVVSFCCATLCFCALRLTHPPHHPLRSDRDTARDPLATSDADDGEGDCELRGCGVSEGVSERGAGAIAIPAVNPDSVEILRGCRAELSVADDAESGDAMSAPFAPIFQFEREGYFCVDRDSVGGLRAAAEAAGRGGCAVDGEAPPPPVRFNQTIALRAAKASAWT
jgi:hypothetical protein